MKQLILAGLLALPVALVGCQSSQSSADASAEATTLTFDVTGMT